MRSKLISHSDNIGSNYESFLSKVGVVTEGLDPFFERHLLAKTSKENLEIITDYILALKTEINLSLGYRRINIAVLTKLCNSLSQRNPKDIERNEIIIFR